MELKIKVGEFKIGKEERKAVNDVLDSQKITEGLNVREFEKKFASYVGTKYAVAVSSGTAALISGLEALKHLDGIQKGEKVITTPLTYVSTSNAIVITGLDPVFVDVDTETFCITPETIKQYLETLGDTTSHRIILPVHLMGYPCEMDKINKIARKYGIITFEDSAQAHGTVYKGKKTGSMSKLSDFSFYIAHNIQAGELGAVTTDDLDVFKTIKKIKANGRMCDCLICTRPEGRCPKLASYRGDDDFDPRFTHELIGYNFKTMEFQAALALVQLKRAEEIKRKRAEIVRYLNDNLSIFSDMLQLPRYNRNVSYMAYPIIIKDGNKLPRKKIRSGLEKLGVETRPLFGCIPIHQPAYSYLKEKYTGRLPNAEHLGTNGFYIGCHQYLTQKDLDYIVETFKKVM